ncbi:histidinol dehydrogenase [Aphanothece sacrum]|uniref:Histidinol dehydrogenase n=1 Tax=Aphanothece sacrum FPU1 TaxID=1920663 RepID=A0A401IGF9_APHSA|nr:histidinol dehydrogenase [Aphanothece sacrum]GBF80296.1 histidinol dehydrogenase [Aphanothece sacrum FPU1]GBF83702.1 histidinol dehydrogenase HisD [Aphanothece sacrum FPU3]
MLRIITQSVEIETELQRIRDRSYGEEIRGKEIIVREILDNVKLQGDLALLDEFQQPIPLKQLRVSGSELDVAYQQISKDLLDAIQNVSKQLEIFHRQRLPKSWVKFEADDVVVGKRYYPHKRAGLYVAGDQCSRLSRVLMQAIPAKVAQVPQVVLVTPCDLTGKIHPDILVAAQVAGIQEIYRLGGVYAIAALTYGTSTIPKVDVITGTGGLDVTLAKKMVYGTVVIDTPVETSDLVIIADRKANPSQIAADILAQVEQDPTTAVIILTPDPFLAEKIQQRVEEQLQYHSQGILTEKAIAHYSLIVLVDSLGQAVAITNQFAPQYLMLALANPWDFVEQIRYAGTIFIGSNTPKAVGDYLGSSGVILPPSGMVRYASAIGVETFLKPSSLIEYSPQALQKLSATLELLSLAEGFSASAEAIRLRLEDNEKL